MTSQALSPPPLQAPLVTPAGMATHALRNWMTGVFNRLGRDFDKVDAAHALAAGAVARGTEVVASGGLQVGGALGGNVGIALYAAATAVAALPAGADPGDWAYALDGRKNGEGAGAGSGLPVFWDGSNWIAVDTGAAVSA